MADKLQERKDMDRAYMWDLTKIYPDDRAWEEDFKKISGEVDGFASYAGKLGEADTLLAFLEAMDDFDRRADKCMQYAYLRHSEDTREEASKSMQDRAMGMFVRFETVVSFAEPEFLALPEETIRALTENEKLAPYHIVLERLADKKAHTLTGPEERILASLGEVLASPQQISSSLEDSDMTFAPAKDKDGHEVEVTNAAFTTLEESKDRTLRENVFKSYYAGYKGHINTFAATMSGNVKSAVAQAQLRHFDSSREMAAAEERVPAVVYTNLIEAVHRHLPDMYRYVRLRRRLLGVDELHFYDIYAPLVPSTPEHFTFEQAKDLLFETVKVYGDEYLNTVKKGCSEGWIDVYPNVGKEGGAYSAGGYLTQPYIMMNFTGNLNSVSTLVHEMGHSMHSWHSNKHQPSTYANYTLFVAEVASTCNENLLIENLLTKTSDPQKRLEYLNQYLENFKGTVFRQTMFAEFEKTIHEAVAEGNALTPQYLCDIYKRLNETYFGPDMVIDDEIAYEWARIPHFYRPFYVYKYATSYSAAVALSEGIRKEAAGEASGNVKRYLEFLSMGCSKDPLDELRHAGVDFSTPEPVDRALDKFASVLDEAETCADALLK